ncbi:helicase associated domain-containing protein [Citricoccus parietis]|uniref:Helicase associated domain-containing protein n=1 Tax=Citricoccus parietis TaxID=592307 RepID=A0ABV5G8Z0_9MICC
MLPSWRLDDRSIENESNWRLRLVELLRFLHDHGRFPQHTDMPGDQEKSLAVWVYAQQSAYRAGTLEPERLQWLDRQVPRWRPVREQEERQGSSNSTP